MPLPRAQQPCAAIDLVDDPLAQGVVPASRQQERLPWDEAEGADHGVVCRVQLAVQLALLFGVGVASVACACVCVPASLRSQHASQTARPFPLHHLQLPECNQAPPVPPFPVPTCRSQSAMEPPTPPLASSGTPTPSARKEREETPPS